MILLFHRRKKDAKMMDSIFEQLSREERDAIAVIVCSLTSQSDFLSEHNPQENALEDT